MGCTLKFPQGLERLFVQVFYNIKLKMLSDMVHLVNMFRGKKNWSFKGSIKATKNGRLPRLPFEFTGSDSMCFHSDMICRNSPNRKPGVLFVNLGWKFSIKTPWGNTTSCSVLLSFLIPATAEQRNCWHSHPSRCAHTWWNQLRSI